MCQLHKTLDVPKLNIPMMWDRETILKNGIDFMHEKQKDLKVLQDLWKIAQETNYYSVPAKLAAKKVKDNAFNAKKEVETLHGSVTNLMNEESKNLQSCAMKKLKEIWKVTYYGLEYFKSVADESCFPSLPNELFREARLKSNQLAFTATVLTVTTHVSNELLFQYDLPWYVFMPMKVSLAACLGINALSLLNIKYRCQPGEAQVEKMRDLFERALAENKVPAPVPVAAKAA